MTQINALSIFHDSLSPLQIDPEIQPLFDQAARINAETASLHTFRELQELLAECYLDTLTRHRAAERIYRGKFADLVRKRYKSLAAFVEWTIDLPPSLSNPGLFNADTSDVRIQRNGWPYAVPNDVEHLLVWTRSKLLAPEACSSKDVWHVINRCGISGLTGDIPQPLRGHAGFQSGKDEAGWEIRKFVLKTWPEDVFDTAFFVNPPRLQSIPTLSHFHIFLRLRHT